MHSVVKWKTYSHWKNIPSNHFFSDFFSKNVGFTKFLAKLYEESKFPKLPQSVVCTVWKNEKFTAKQISFRQIKL